ncbi:MAG: SRPBCC family protein [Desulfobacula sp.]|nr:SRPBCC family protein [Desulfobacula sp.]
MKVEKSIKITAVPEKIWPFLVDPKKIPLWFDSFKKCQFTSEKHTGVGATYYVEEKVPGPLRKINFESTTWNDNKSLTLKMTSGKNVNSYEIHWQLQKDQSGTKFHFTEEVGMPFGPIGKILGLLGQSTADKMVEDMLGKLKSLSEK